MSDLLELVLGRDNPCQTTITNSNTGKALYQVETQFAKETVTNVTKETGEVIASWVWKNLRSDVITLGRAPPVSGWLKKSLFSDTTTVKDDMGRRYNWKPSGPGKQLQLFEDGNDSEIVAQFHVSRTIWNHEVKPAVSTVKPARLVLDRRWSDIQDIIVVSFLVLEKNRRAKKIYREGDAEDIRRRFRAPWDSPNTPTPGELANIAGPSF